MQSIISPIKCCYVCQTTQNLHLHQIFAGGNRRLSEKYGLTVYLCGYHHNLSENGVHFNKELDTELKQVAQRQFERKYNREYFIKLFMKNYL